MILPPLFSFNYPTRSVWQPAVAIPTDLRWGHHRTCEKFTPLNQKTLHLLFTMVLETCACPPNPLFTRSATGQMHCNKWCRDELRRSCITTRSLRAYILLMYREKCPLPWTAVQRLWKISQATCALFPNFTHWEVDVQALILQWGTYTAIVAYKLQILSMHMLKWNVLRHMYVYIILTLKYDKSALPYLENLV